MRDKILHGYKLLLFSITRVPKDIFHGQVQGSFFYLSIASHTEQRGHTG